MVEYLANMGIRPSIRESDPFGTVFRELRRAAQCSPEDVAKLLDISVSYVNMIERNKRGPLKDRDAILKFAKKVNASQWEKKILLVKAGLVQYFPPLTPEEEGQRQRQERPTELWVVAEHILDTIPSVYPVTRRNIEKRKTRYVFFQPDDNTFEALRSRLLRDLGGSNEAESILESQLECIIAPPTFFFSSFSIANPGKSEMTGVVSLHNNGEISNVFPLDPTKLRSIYSVIADIYFVLRTSTSYSCKSGSFYKHFPKSSDHT